MVQGKKYKKSEKVLKIVSIVLIAVGLLVVSLSRIPTEPFQKMTFIGVGVGIVSVGVGFLGVWIAQKSDIKMRAIANLEFDEKGAMIQEYEAFFNQNFDETKFERFTWDLEAIAHVARWADKDKRIRISQSVDKIVAAVNGKVTEDNLARVRSLSSQIRESAVEGEPKRGGASLI